MKKLSWRNDVKAVMYAAAIKQNRLSADGKAQWNYRWEHVQAVVTCAVKLAELTGADADVVEAAAWLHDIRKETKELHPKKGAKFARKFLPKTDFPSKKIEAVAIAIEDHMGLWRDKPLKNLESQVLWDADKLTKIGLTAFVHWSANSVTTGRVTTTEKLIKQLDSADFRVKTVASMHTAPAKRAAQQRFDAYDRVLNALKIEWTAIDL